MNKTPVKSFEPGIEEDEFYNRHLDETPEQRAQRLYAGKGGPLVSWLLDEAHRRQQTYRDMATDLQVTYGYINQLRSGLSLSSAHGVISALCCGDRLAAYRSWR
jgi:hypothetical protein